MILQEKTRQGRFYCWKKIIDRNIKNIKKVFKKILDSSNKKTKPIFVNNFSWLSKLNYIEFLRDIGSHFTINKMLTFDSVKLRLEREQSLSYMEFNYMILQAYDFFNCLEKISVFANRRIRPMGKHCIWCRTYKKNFKRETHLD